VRALLGSSGARALDRAGRCSARLTSVLPPTSQRLLQADAVPYFLWDTGMTVAEVRRVIAEGDPSVKDGLVARILREANSRDVWLFLDWAAIEEYGG
jgi:hypothetical protein